jgi:hypothetical protein
MKNQFSLPATLALSTALSLTSSILGQGSGSAQSQPLLVVPDVMLNEVMYDPLGDDVDTKFGSEWIELYVHRATDLGQWSIHDNQNNLIGALPSVQIPAQTYVQVILGGLAVYEVDDTPNNGDYSITLGKPLADHLPNAHHANQGGGLRLKQNGALRDKVYWGCGVAPPGSGGRFFDTSLATGAPMNEGDSLGRASNPATQYTGQNSDWSRCGGINAAGPTPAQRNGVYPTDADDILKIAQSGFCEIVNSWLYMTNQQGSVRFTDASVADVVTYTAPGELEVSATHALSAIVGGAPGAIIGTLVARLDKDETAGNVNYAISLSGVMTCTAGWSMDVDYSKQVSGFHTNTISGTTTTDVTFTEGGVDFQFDNTVVRHLARTGDHTWTLSDQRTGIDYGGAGLKSSTANTHVTRHGDGDYESLFDMTRDMPMGPPKPGTIPALPYQQRLVIEGRNHFDDLGAGSSSITIYDEYRNGQLEASLAAGNTGAGTVVVAPSSTEEPFGSMTYSMSLPLMINNQPKTINTSIHSQVDVPNGVLLESCNGQINVNGFSAVQFSIFADPPISEGESSSGGGGGGLGDAAVNCATKGAAIGAGAGTVVGGTAGAVGGATVGGAIGTLGGPPGAVVVATAGGVKGAAVGAIVGATAGGVLGGGVGAAACMAGYGAKKIGKKAKQSWKWVSSWF